MIVVSIHQFPKTTTNSRSRHSRLAAGSSMPGNVQTELEDGSGCFSNLDFKLPPVLPLAYLKISSGDRYGRFLGCIYFLQTLYISPIVPSENENDTVGKSIQFPLISFVICMYWIG